MALSAFLAFMMIITLLPTLEGLPGGAGSANRQYDCGGSCHATQSTAAITMSTASLTVAPGQSVNVTVNLAGGQASGTPLGVMIVTSLVSGSSLPSDDGWTIVRDPGGVTTYNYYEVNSYPGSVTLVWELTAPFLAGYHSLYARVMHGGGDAYAGDDVAGLFVLVSGPSAAGQRSVDYRYYDFFNVTFGEWWDMRWTVMHTEQIISYSYPTMFYHYSQPPGNIQTYSNMMLDVTGRNMSEINMNSHPEFLPFLGTERGGNASLDWYMQYLTPAEMARYPPATSAWYDGWVISLNGTTTMDKQSAMAVLDVTSAGFDDFANWWTANRATVIDSYGAWLLYEGNHRLDIYNMYEYPLTPLSFNLVAQKVADKVVLSYDLVSWGMEGLMTRWLHEAFIPTEHWFEDFNLHANIGPESADVDITTEVAYGIYAYETTLIPGGKTHGDPCWVWRTNHLDNIRPTIMHPDSDYTQYMDFNYSNRAPGSLWYGRNMLYDYAPSPHNLSVNETLRIEFPTGPQLFKEQAYYPNGTPILDGSDINLRIVNTTGNMTLNYAEPMLSDNPDLSPGTMSVDNVAGRLTFTGPIDMWTWSKDQTTHASLASEWDRLGIIPRSIPYVEFKLDRNPIADAGPDQVVLEGDLVTFDGSASWDDIQIMNYTWEYWYNGSLVHLWGAIQTFEFLIEGIYNVTLTVHDWSNQTSSAMVKITVVTLVPEFPIVLTPVGGILAVVLLAGISRRRGRTKRT